MPAKEERNMTNPRSIALYGVLLLMVTSCVSVPLAPVEEDATAKQFSPAQGKCLVYLVRPAKGVGMGITITPVVDRQMVGALKAETYAVVEVSPGKHVVALGGSGMETSAAVTIEAEAGQVYFVQVYPKMGMFAARSGVEQMSEEEGKKLVQESKLIKGF